MPEIEKPQYTQRHYTFSILLDPEQPGYSPQLDLALSLLYMEYPAEQAKYLNETLYSPSSLDTYKDHIIIEQRKNYRSKAAEMAQSGLNDERMHNWWYSETVNIREALGQGLIVERDYNAYSGGAHPDRTKRYYVLDMIEYKQLNIDDFFVNFHGDQRLRDIVYEELRKYSKLTKTQPLSEGIFFTDEPELSFNFFITQEGLGLHWDPYQIAPYVAGYIEIILPWNAIRPMMSYPGIELLTKFNIYLFM
jgi:hypothetical protein